LKFGLLVFGAGYRAASFAARLSTDVPPAVLNRFVGLPLPSTPMGTPQNPFGLRFDACVNRALKSSPTKVGLPLQSSAA
jgi:hypothetical protein